VIEEAWGSIRPEVESAVIPAIELSQQDWDSYETSWSFRVLPINSGGLKVTRVEDSWNRWNKDTEFRIHRLRVLETANNRSFIKAYGLQEDLSPDVSEDQITIAPADRETDMKRLISYALGCMMGRYSLDEHGLIYAHSGNLGFDPFRYQTFPAAEDGMIPLSDMEWFSNDAVNRFTDFLEVAWSPETLADNLKFVAESLSPKKGETPKETIRRYFSTCFFKDHLQTYKNRPIYWLFSSGKQRAFECLVYLHRYNEATLSRMRSHYVTPLQGKINARIEYLRNEIDTASSASIRTRLQKQLDMLKKKQEELAAFDSELRHYADKRISLDLDDGVKVNYGKFSSLLAEVKKVTGKK